MSSAETAWTALPHPPEYVPSTWARGRSVHEVAGVLPDGTVHYAPIGVVIGDGPVVMCHLCGEWFRSVLAHLRSHGWSQEAYRTAFGLERGQPLEGTSTRERRAAALTVRRSTDPAIREGCDVGMRWAKSGGLSRAAALAARGRPQPEQRRRKTLATLAAISLEKRAAATRRYADERLRETATAAAQRLGFSDIGTLVRERIRDGSSLAAISRAAGLHKDWLSRHLAAVDPEAAAAVDDEVRGRRRARWDQSWLPVVEALGFPDVAVYLEDRHLRKHWTVAAIGVEVGMSRPAVESAMRRHGIDRHLHATSRSRTQRRADAIAHRFGFDSIDDYLSARRAEGLSWKRIAHECDEAETWVRRRAGLC
ncbi:MucR family transcriptional regulator [Pseudonocardia alaniniphila]|uniref:MucR family transcriptional regulator n=1 Tax=Pseudonocardia alaniniphila TaxID=75291 RepID=A0ABS9TDZ6_9PSEU|nr:MucR family transcriptional regulator [Pseudonocardia alaniniphila]MCH6166755.1 MucR family transcriptional regulator [Pseudonocardia alaniniphila]